ncbi:hypothetical protein AD006_14170 [Pseudonocardia sp. EC080610-09]|nr:hypothetical protein FRP1_06550 [Pseudonocardia sp. EC080625-04]ALL76176.1 hypothetical protein AD006_14170 [Pseudonocardia sp. EC080610-09]ALL83201.1 hypothetical protein AD017_21995 [Pseudonocardia sp. EC080619-01]
MQARHQAQLSDHDSILATAEPHRKASGGSRAAPVCLPRILGYRRGQCRPPRRDGRPDVRCPCDGPAHRPSPDPTIRPAPGPLGAPRRRSPADGPAGRDHP